MINGKVTEAELKNLKLRILSYPIFEKITVKREDELKTYLMEKM